MKTILVPTDFSETARNAAEYAVKLAKDLKANILLLHIYHLPIPASEVPLLVTPDGLQKENELLLKKEAAHLKRKAGVEITYKAKIGLAVDEILEEEKNVSLIIMGIKGAGKLSEALMGSITTTILRKAKTPTLVIPEKATYKKPENIVFASDYDPRSEMGKLDVLKEFISAFHSKLYILNVKKSKEVVSVKEAIAGLRLENKLNDVEHIYYFTESEDPVEGISHFIKTYNADIVVTIPHVYNLVERLFHKSISKKMAFQIHLPLLALPE